MRPATSRTTTDAVLEVLSGSRDLVVAFDRTGAVTWRNVAAADRSPSGDALASALATALAGTPASFEWGETGPGGVRAWYSAEVTPYEDGAICISRDITELKRTEQRLRRSEQLLVDTQGVAHLGTWDWDITQPTATWSDELYRIYGLTPETYTPSYEQYLTMVHPDDRQRVIDATNRVFHEHVPYSHDERIFRPDGSIRHLHTWAFPVLDDAGTLVRLVGVCQDITDRATAEEALQKLNVELEHRVSERTTQLQEAMRELEGFNSMVSHDLRAPLSVISMAIDLIERDKENTSTKTPGYIDRMRRAIHNMSALMDDLLMLAKVDKGALQPVEVDVSAVCADLIGELRIATPERAAEITIEPNMRCMVDPSLFRAVMGNLVGNAWKYSSRRNPARIEIGTVDRPDGRALYVRDNGIGFAMADRDKLFRPFERLENAADFSGTGVGLAIVHKILDRHGGRVDAESAPDKGATFFLMLPAASWTR